MLMTKETENKYLCSLSYVLFFLLVIRSHQAMWQGEIRVVFELFKDMSMRR